MSKTASPNPQGKGLVPVLEHWQQHQPVDVAPGNMRDLFAAYFSSLLVLSARVRFKPVRGIHYFLYYRQQQWHLSLIDPYRWDEKKRGLFLGRCQLQQNMTWTIEVTKDLESQPALVAALQEFQQGLYQRFHDDTTLGATLPFYEAALPFYSRMCATGLAKSMHHAFGELRLLEQPARLCLEAGNISGFDKLNRQTAGIDS